MTAPVTGNEDGHPGRDADATRGALVQAARRRFAADGYRQTTVRRIATDAGVDAALINRYFVSKAGLFRACIVRTYSEVDIEAHAWAADLEGIIKCLVWHTVNESGRDDPLQLLLLLLHDDSPGDDAVDVMRRRARERFVQQLAAAAGWRADNPVTAPALLRAHLAVAALLGIVLLRTSVGAEPMTSIDAAELADPITETLRTILDGS